jgi:peptide/nickel transport system permease protein
VGTRQYVIRKIVQAILTLIAILIFNFFLFRVWSPGDPVSFLTRGQGANITREEREALIHEYGLDKPVWGQFAEYMKDTFVGKLGVSSFYQGETVMSVFWRFLPPTLLLVGISTALSMLIGIWMGIRSGWRRGSVFDRSSMFFSLILYSMPEFWLGMLLLLLFSTALGWFPVGGRVSTNVSSLDTWGYIGDVAEHLFLPVLTLTLGYLGEFYLLMRSSLLDVLGEDYITTARAKGLRERTVVRHGLRAASASIVTIFGLDLGGLLGGAVITEHVFSMQGLGRLLLDSVEQLDLPVVVGTTLFAAFMIVFANLVVDIVYAVIDPRVTVG